MKDRAAELRTSHSGKSKKDPEQAVREAIAELPEPDRSLTERVHELILETVPELTTKLRYGMPTYLKDGKVVCFFQAAAKFGTRYSTLGFDEGANLDDGEMWPTSFAITELTDAARKRIQALLKQAAS
ncbi:iron chaperone [Ruicaihuangia caeni]|uniref:iron chaperone n=1 Tax=Ruicaihuangia caeni TaxID=3042517 RepID=UPI00339019F3